MANIIPTIFVGLGGTGFYAISAIKKHIGDKYFKGDPDFPLVSYMAVDTEFLTADKISKLSSKNKDEVEFITTFDASNIKKVERLETVVIPDNISMVLENPGTADCDDFVPERAHEYIEVKGDGASGVGLIGKIALANNFSRVATMFKDKVDTLAGNDVMAQLKSKEQYSHYGRDERVNVYIFCSFGGGTGKGMSLVFSAMAKEILHARYERQRQKYNISIVNYLPACFKARGRSVANDEATYQYILKNQYATYKEFDWCFTHGYTNEQFFKKYFHLEGNQRTTDFVNTIYNVSPKLENSGMEVGSYEAVNNIVAKTFTFMVMNEDSKEIIKNISNDVQKVDAAISERGTGLKRNRKYSRLGRYTLIMPEERLFDYALTHFTNKMIEDFIDGGIAEGISYAEIMDPAGDKNYAPANVASRIIEDTGKVFDDHYNTAPQFNAGSIHFPDVTNYQVNTFVNPIQAKIRAYNTYRDGFVKGNSIKDCIESIDTTIVESVKKSGLRYTKDMIENMQQIYESQVQTRLEDIRTLNDYGAVEILRGLGGEDAFGGKREIDHFTLDYANGTSNNIKKKYDSEYLNLSEYALPEKFEAVSSIIQDLTKPKKKSLLGKVFGTVEDERIQFPSDGEKIVFDIIKRMNRQMQKVWKVFIAQEYLYFANEINHALKAKLGTIESYIQMIAGGENDVIIKNLSEYDGTQSRGGLLNQIKSELKQKSLYHPEASTSNVIGDNASEYELFCVKILPERHIEADIHKAFNYNIVDKMFMGGVGITSADVFYLTTKDTLSRLKSERFDERGNKKWTIMNYFKYLHLSEEKSTRQQIEENLYKIRDNSRFLSSIDVDKFIQAGAAEASFPQQNFLEISDTKFLHANVKDFESFVHKAKMIDQDDEEEITITRLQGLIPLFAFTDLQEAQKLYHQTLNSKISDDEKAEFKVKTHSSTYFMSNIDEPFGQTLQIDKYDITNLWNTAFHLGVVRVDEKDFIQILKNPYHNDHTHFEDPNRSNATIKRERWIKTKSYRDSYMDYFHLTNTIKDLLFERMKILAEDPTQGSMVLQKYFTDKSYPIIPKSIYDIIITKLDKRKYQDLKYFAQNIEQKYLTAIDSISDTVMRKREFALTEKDLKTIYGDRKQYLAIFPKLYSGVGASLKEKAESIDKEKIDKINTTTKWMIIYEDNIEKGIKETMDDPKGWKDIITIYNKYSKVSEPELNVYSPELDIVVNYEDFLSLVENLKYEDEMKNKRYHVIVKEGGKWNRLTIGNELFTIDQVLEVLTEDKDILVSDIEKPKKEEDWYFWQENKLLKSLFERKNKSDDPGEDDIFIPGI